MGRRKEENSVDMEGVIHAPIITLLPGSVNANENEAFRK